jgi:hypothetical protein
MKSQETEKRSKGECRETRAGQAKRYEPVREFDWATSYCPLYLAWRILDEARDYFRTPIPEAFADKLAHRAEAVFAHHPSWQRRFKSARGREFILMSMRHWLAGVLARERPALFRALPESFKVGHPLPQKQTGGAAAPPYHKPKMVGLTCRSAIKSSQSRPVSRFVHGCELLTA